MRRLTRSTGIWIVLALGLVRAPAMAQVPQIDYTVNMLYSTANQSYWDDLGTGGFSYNWNIGASWNKQINSGGYYDVRTPDIDLGLLGTIPGIDLGEFGGVASIDTTGNVGLMFHAYASSGTVDVNAPVIVKLTYPQYIPKGRFFKVQTTIVLDKNASMHTVSPDAGASLDALCDLSFDAGIGAEAFSETLFNFSLPHLGFNKDVTLFDSQKLIDKLSKYAVYQYPPSPAAAIFTASLHYPVFDSDGILDSTQTALVSTGKDSFLTLKGDISNLLVSELNEAGIPLPPLSESFSFPADKDKKVGSNGGVAGSYQDGSSSKAKKDKSFFNFKLKYSLLDLYTEGDFGFQQDFKFAPKPKIQIVAVDQNGNALQAYSIVNGVFPNETGSNPVPNNIVTAGDAVYFYMSANSNDRNQVKLSPTFTYDNEFTNKTSFAITGGLYFDLLSFKFSGKAGPISLGSVDWTPVPTQTIIDTTVPITLFHNTYNLTGFSSTPLIGPPLSIVQQDLALPAIGAFSPTSANDRNKPNVYWDDPTDPLTVTLNTTGNMAWPQGGTYDIGGDKNGIATRVLLDDDGKGHGYALSQLDYTNSGQTLRVLIQSNQLTPGTHHLTAYAQNSGFERVSTVDFLVNHWKPALNDNFVKDPTKDDSNNHVSVLPTGSPDMKLFVTGDGFAADTQVLFNGTSLPIQSIDPSQGGRLTFTLPAAQMLSGKVGQITVVNPTPGGGAADRSATIVIPNPTPQLNAVTPSPLTPGSTASKLTLIGSGFVPTSTIYLENFKDGTFYTANAEYVNSTMLRVAVPATFQAGSWVAQVNNDIIQSAGIQVPQNGGVTQTVAFTIQNPTPQVQSLSPGVAFISATAISVTLNGQNFRNGVQATIGTGLSAETLTTTYVSDTQIKVVIPVKYLSKAGMLTLTVSNLSPSAGPSDPILLPVGYPTPDISKPKPSTARPGGAAFQVTINGGGFTPDSMVQWNGRTKPSKYLSPTQMTVDISSSDITTEGSAALTVVNPVTLSDIPDGGVSNVWTFSIGGSKPKVSVTDAKVVKGIGTTSLLNCTVQVQNANARPFDYLDVNLTTIQVIVAGQTYSATAYDFGAINVGTTKQQKFSISVGSNLRGKDAVLHVQGNYTLMPDETPCDLVHDANFTIP